MNRSSSLSVIAYVARIPLGSLAVTGALIWLFSLSYWQSDYWGHESNGAPGSSLEAAYFLAGVVVAFVTASAVYVARHQLQRTNEQIDIANETRLAEVLLRVDEQWSSRQYRYARNKLREAVEASDGNLVGYMQEVARDNYGRYLILLELADLIEKIGVLSRRGYVKIGDVDNLLGSPILGLFNIYRDVIEDLRDRNSTPTMYENFEWLANEISIRRE